MSVFITDVIVMENINPYNIIVQIHLVKLILFLFICDVFIYLDVIGIIFIFILFILFFLFISLFYILFIFYILFLDVVGIDN